MDMMRKQNEPPKRFDAVSRVIRVTRSGNLVVLTLEGAGIMGFDYATGKKLFTID